MPVVLVQQRPEARCKRPLMQLSSRHDLLARPLPSNAGEVAYRETPAQTGTQNVPRCRKQSSDDIPIPIRLGRPIRAARAVVAQIPISPMADRGGTIIEHTRRFGKTRAACVQRRARRGRCETRTPRPGSVAGLTTTASLSLACTISGNGAAAPGTTHERPVRNRGADSTPWRRAHWRRATWSKLGRVDPSIQRRAALTHRRYWPFTALLPAARLRFSEAF